MLVAVGKPNNMFHVLNPSSTEPGRQHTRLLLHGSYAMYCYRVGAQRGAVERMNHLVSTSTVPKLCM